MIIAERLKMIMESHDLSIQELADISDLPIDTIKNILYERTTDPRISTIIAICKALKINYYELLDEELSDEQELLKHFRNDSANGKAMLLMIARDHNARQYNSSIKKNTIICAMPKSHTADGIVNALCRNEFIDVDEPNAYMGFGINTNNFMEMDIYDGDIILIEHRNPNNDELAVFSNGVNSYFRRYKRYNGKIHLEPLNKTGKDIVLDNFKGWNIVGTFIGVHRN